MAYTLVPTELIVDGAVTSAKLDTNISISGTLGVTGELTLATHMIMGDNDKIKIGTGGDLEIYHDGSNSYISNSTGNIYLADTNGSVHIQAKLNEESIVCTADGAVTLYYDNAVKLATSSAGVSVTGSITADGILKDTASSFNYISGGNASNAGANILLYGQSHASVANTTVFRASGSETARILSDGKLLVGKTAASIATAGVELRPNGQLFATQSANYPLLLNRTTSDGTIIQLRKDNTTVGNIGSFSAAGNSYLTIGSGDTGLLVNSISDALQPWNISTNAGRDAAIDLGATSGRFKDLYLSNATKVGSAATEYAEGHIRFKFNGGAFIDQNTVGQSLNFRVSGSSSLDTTAMTVDSSGNVGIGTSSPDNTLMVQGASTDGTGSTGNVALFEGPSGTNGLKIFINDTENAAGLQTIASDDLLLNPHGGNVGIGQTSPYNLSVFSSLSLGGTSGKGGLIQIKHTNDTARGYLYAQSDAITLESVDTNIIRFVSNAAERMRLDTSGRVLVGLTGASGFGTLEATSFTTEGSCYLARSSGNVFVGTTGAIGPGIIAVKSTATTTGCLGLHNTNNGGSFIRFANAANNAVIGIIQNNNDNSTSYITTSDYRLKENVNYDFNALDRISQLKPARFNFINNADTTVDGFLAHEVQDIVPEAISGEKDAVREEEYEITPAVLDDDGNVVTEAEMGTREVPDYQGIDQSKLVPLLTKAIQEQQTIIEDLKSRIETLENE